MQFNTSKLIFVQAEKGSATNDWATVAGNVVAGGIRIGGFAGSGTPIAGNNQTICKGTLKIENAACPDGGALALDAINLKDCLKGVTVTKGAITVNCSAGAAAVKN